MSDKSKEKKEKPERDPEISFFLTMRITKMDKTPILYKFDATRFNREETIKLKTKTEYRVSIEVGPAPKTRLR